MPTEKSVEGIPASGGEALADHLAFPRGMGVMPDDAHTGIAGGAACGDLIAISLRLDGADPDGRIAEAGFEASGCGASIAAGSAVVALVEGASLLDAAKVGVAEVSAELGGLSPMKLHAAELAADALHRALGAAARGAALAPREGRLLIAMSGGVDSAVAAMLSAQQGSEAIAVTLELWGHRSNDEERSCCSALAQRSARSLAHRMGMAHFSLDLREEFRDGVVSPWLEGHAAGLTPNPCVRCNGEVRLDGMLELAQRLGAEALVTGHYARIAADAAAGGAERAAEPAAGSEHATRATRGGAPRPPLLRVAFEERKDQSYALAALPRSSLARMRFPLGELSKAQVRALAEQAGLPVARRPDSQDLCFLAGTSQRQFLEDHGLAGREGDILDEHGNALGRHEGAHRYTIGQRHGLRIGGGKPLYVLSTNVEANTVTVGSRQRLLAGTIEVAAAVLHRDGAEVDAVKVRYRGARVSCRLEGEPEVGLHERLLIRLATAMERTAGGQLACLYSGEVLVGYGTIVA